jgi:D-alanyl-D-alanine carboxypeptidase/D-alanyl-D-alanine-endopeptidase (penicillin-binding protein 4)
MKIKITFLALFFVMNAVAQDNNLTKVVNQIRDYEFFANGQIALLATDMKTGEVIASLNPDMSVIPASNTKLFSTAAALELYGPDYTYKTRLYYNGKIDPSGVLYGNVIIKGDGDPTLGSKFFYDRENFNYNSKFVEAVKAAGIKRISGNVIGDCSSYVKETTPSTWSWEDMGNYYGAVPNGLTVHDNYTTLHFKTGKDGTTPVYTGCDPEIKDLRLEVDAVVSKNVTRENTNVFGKSFQNNKYIEGFLPENKIDVTVRTVIPDPALFAASWLLDSLDANGVQVLGQPLSRLDSTKYVFQDTAKTLLCTIESPALSEIIQQTNYYSINLYAEHCLSLVGLKQFKTTAVNYACWGLTNFWKSKGMDTRGMSINDGCGLSHFNIVTPRQLCFLLTYMHNESQYYEAFNNSLTMCGGKGTMAGMCAGTRAVNNARGKSGTIRRVKSYSGYVTTRSGRELAFSIIINNFTCSSSETKFMMEKYIAALADYNK